jgi:hypothetical protein
LPPPEAADYAFMMSHAFISPGFFQMPAFLRCFSGHFLFFIFFVHFLFPSSPPIFLEPPAFAFSSSISSQLRFHARLHYHFTPNISLRFSSMTLMAFCFSFHSPRLSFFADISIPADELADIYFRFSFFIFFYF